MIYTKHRQVWVDGKRIRWIDYNCRTAYGSKQIWRKFSHRVKDFVVVPQDEFPFEVYIKAKEKIWPRATYLAKIPQPEFDCFEYIGFHGLDRLRNYAKEKGLV